MAIEALTPGIDLSFLCQSQTVCVPKFHFLDGDIFVRKLNLFGLLFLSGNVYVAEIEVI